MTTDLNNAIKYATHITLNIIKYRYFTH